MSKQLEEAKALVLLDIKKREEKAFQMIYDITKELNVELIGLEGGKVSIKANI